MQVWLRLRKVDWWWKKNPELNCLGMAWTVSNSFHMMLSFTCGWCVSHLTSSGPLPAVSKGTHVIIPLVENLEDDRWEAAVVKQDGNRIKLSVNSPPTAVIGRYQLTVETSCATGQAVSTHDPANDIYMLFNPWCEGTETLCNTVSCKAQQWTKKLVKVHSEVH